MPIFEFDGKKYDVEDRYMNDFSKAFPDATSVFERENKRYRVKASDYGSFMKYYQDPIMIAFPVKRERKGVTVI